jgi:multisubunit Na+/H+ antiporter MnhF subunit
MAEPLKATFFAFRPREQKGVLLRLTIVFGVAALAIWAAFIAAFWSSLQPVATWYLTIIEATINNDTAAIESAGFPSEFFGIAGGIVLWLFPFYILCAAYEAGCLRWLIHGEVKGFMGLSLGAPSWRVWGVYWIWLLLNIAFALVMGIASAVMLGIMTASTGGDAASTASVQPVFEILQLVLQVYFGVRLAPAAAATIARRKFAFFDAWAVTKGRFLSLLGSFAVLYVIYLVAAIALAIAAFAIVLGPNAPDLAAAANDPAQMQATMIEIFRTYIQSLFNPQNWIALGVLQFVGMVIAFWFYIACYGVNARAAQAALAEGKIGAPEA